MPTTSLENINVLDKGSVSLLYYMGSDLMVVNAARVSFAKVHDEFDKDKDERLIKYLAKHNHWTPFAHPQITLHVKAPIAIRTQLFKHKQGLVENEVSRRYVDDEPEFYIPEWRKQSSNNKQGSDGLYEKPNKESLKFNYKYDCLSAKCTYMALVARGVAKEQARFVLPQSTYTEWYWTGSLAAFARVVGLRDKTDAQWEVQQYAKAISQLIEPLFPVSWKHLTGDRNGSEETERRETQGN